MKIVFDIDDTISETDESSERYMLEFFNNNNLPYRQIAKNVRFAEAKFDWNRETAISWYKHFGDEMMLNFSCKPNAVEVINALYEKGHKIILATARAHDFHVEPEKITKLWLEKNNIKYNKIYMGRIDKENICKDEGADFFVDDDLKITGTVAEHCPKTKVLLMNSNYNESLIIDPKVTRISGFIELLSQIEQVRSPETEAEN